MNSATRLDIANNRPELLIDFLDMFCGKHLGSGGSRDVYEFQYDKSKVIKIERLLENDGIAFIRHANVLEYAVWSTVCHSTYAKWFAKCHWISDNGLILIQSRTHEKPKKPRPEKVPAFFTDLKDDNFGWIGNQFVCHDYPLCLDRFSYFALNDKMRKYEPWKR